MSEEQQRVVDNEDGTVSLTLTDEEYDVITLWYIRNKMSAASQDMFERSLSDGNDVPTAAYHAMINEAVNNILAAALDEMQQTKKETPNE